MKVYWIRAQAPRRVLALVKYLGFDVEFIEMDLMGGAMKQPEYIAINPNMKAPTLVDGDVVLWESSAIMAYLCNKVGSDMWPARTEEQVEVLRWLSWNDHHWAPAVAPFYFEHIVKPTFGVGKPDGKALIGKETEFMRYGTVLDNHLKGKTTVACSRLTIADFQLASMATYWRKSEMPLDRFSSIVGWLDGLMRIPAWKDPWPDRAEATA